MSEEEKKAIEYLQESLKATVTHKKQLDIIVNLIEKQNNRLEQLEKENKELKEELQKADSITQSCIFNGKKESEISYRKAINLLEQYKKDCISKSVIRDKINKRQSELIQELKTFKDDVRLNTLQELYYEEILGE